MREIYRKHRKQGMTKMGLQEYKIIGMLLVIELLFGFYSAYDKIGHSNSRKVFYR